MSLLEQKVKLKYTIEYKELINQDEDVRNLLQEKYEHLMRDEDGNLVIMATKFVSRNDFHKIFLQDFLTLLGLVGNQETKIFAYILKETRYENIPTKSANTFTATYDEIAKSTHSSKSTVMRVMKKLIAIQAITKISSRTYRINPNLIATGREYQQAEILGQFNDELVNNLTEENNLAEAEHENN